MEEVKRKLASIQRVESLRAIEGADKIECAQVLGWEVVVRKGELKVGGLCCFVEIDSVLPEKPWSEFMRDRRFRVRTIKLRKQVSQGLVFPLAEIPELAAKHGIGLCLDDDVTELLGITKYDPEAAREKVSTTPRRKIGVVRRFLMRYRWYRWVDRKIWRSEVRGWPQFIPHTDEERIQNVPWLLLPPGDPERTYYVTEKLDGQSASYAVVWRKTWTGRMRSGFYVCSRRMYLPTVYPCNWWRIAERYSIRRHLEEIGENICIQGEIVGPGVQGNKYKFDDLRLFVFNAWDIDQQRYYAYREIVELCADLAFDMVPVLDEGRRTLPESVAVAVEGAKGTTRVVDRIVLREGVVWRSEQLVNSRAPLSFKVVNPDFLLKFEKEDEERQQAGTNYAEAPK